MGTNHSFRVQNGCLQSHYPGIDNKKQERLQNSRSKEKQSLYMKREIAHKKALDFLVERTIILFLPH